MSALAAQQAARRGPTKACQPGRRRRAARRDWPLWEVFVRSRRGLSHQHVGTLHAPDAEMALRNARDLYTRRSEGVSHLGGAGRRDHRVAARTRRTPSSTRPPTSPTGTRRSTRSRPGCSTCEPPARTRWRSPPTRCGSATTRWCSRSGCGEWIAHAPQLEEDVALANIALDLLGQARALLTYAGRVEGAGPRRGRAGLPARRARLPQRAAGRAAERRLRGTPWPGCCSSPPTSSRSTSGCSQRRRDARRRRRPRPSRRSPTTATTPRSGSLRLGDGTERATSACRPAWSGLAVHRGAVRRRHWVAPRWSSDGVAVDAGRAPRRTGEGLPAATSSPRRRSSCRTVCAGGPAEAGGASTPRRWATCWRRCSTSTGPTPAPAGSSCLPPPDDGQGGGETSKPWDRSTRRERRLVRYRANGRPDLSTVQTQ